MAEGLFDFLKTPEGQGLLSGVFGYAANARRGTPWNNLGRGGVAGLMGYGSALERQDTLAQREQAKKLQDLQMQQAQGALTDAQARREAEARQRTWKENLPSVLNQSVYGSSDFGPTKAPDTQAIESYLMQADSPYADKVIERKMFPKTDDYKEVNGTLLRVGPNGVTPVYQAPQKEPELPSAVREYEYAKKNGYKGTFEQFKAINPTIMAGAIAPLRAAQEENLKGRTAYELPKPPAASFSVTVPGGQTFTFPDQKSLNNFKMKAGIK